MTGLAIWPISLPDGVRINLSYRKTPGLGSRVPRARYNGVQRQTGLTGGRAGRVRTETVTEQEQAAGRPRWRLWRSGDLHGHLVSAIPEPIVLLLYALVIGVVGGYGAVGFRLLLRLATHFFFVDMAGWLNAGLHVGGAAVAVLPVVGLVLVSAMTRYWAPEAKGHGVPEVMAAIAEKDSVIRPRVVLVKAAASAICIGSGGSVGREGPIVQIGSGFGSVVGQVLRLSGRQRRLLVACGAGAGIAATFNAPIGGVMFATEVILGSFALQNFTAIVVASVVSAAIGRIYLGDHPSFPMPVYHLGHFGVFWVYALLGIGAGLWGVVYIRVLYSVEDWFDWTRWPFWVKAVVGGLMLGVVGLEFPQIFGVGYQWVDQALGGQLPVSAMITLLVLKLAATAVTIAAGGSGGVFSPGLYQGAMFGGALGVAISAVFPHLGISTGAMAAMGMAGVFAGSAQAPVTAIMMLFEMTGDYNIILPLMITAVLAATVSGALSGDSIYTLKLTRRGLDINRLRNPDRMKAMLVADALPADHFSLGAGMTVYAAWQKFETTGQWYAWVRDDAGRLVGSVARAQVLEALTQGRSRERVETLLPRRVERISDRATLAEALITMQRLGVTYLLVTRGDQPVGVLGSSDIVQAYKSLE